MKNSRTHFSDSKTLFSFAIRETRAYSCFIYYSRDALQTRCCYAFLRISSSSRRREWDENRVRKSRQITTPLLHSTPSVTLTMLPETGVPPVLNKSNSTPTGKWPLIKSQMLPIRLQTIFLFHLTLPPIDSLRNCDFNFNIPQGELIVKYRKK